MTDDRPRLRLRTPRLELVAADAGLTRADAARDRATLARLLEADVPADWPPAETLDVLAFFAATLAAQPEQCGWWGWFVIATGGTDPGPRGEPVRILVGGAGFKGPPDVTGAVEIGYSILPAYKRRGYASEATAALAAWCFADPRVRVLAAETAPDNTASLRVIERLGLEPCGPGLEAGMRRFRMRRAAPDASP